MANFPNRWVLLKTRNSFDKFIFRIRDLEDASYLINDFPIAVWITIRLNKRERSKLLNEAEALEREIEVNAEESGLALLVGCITRKRTRELLYYINDSRSFRTIVEDSAQRHLSIKLSVMEYPNDRGVEYSGLREILDDARQTKIG